jgi:long-chain acyl-CoA synthetase
MSSPDLTGFKRVFEIIQYQQQKYPQAMALNAFVNNSWRGMSIEELQQKSEALACWMLREGYKKEDKIVIIPRMGHPDWVALDFACQQIGVITVPIHPVSTEDEVRYILEETGASLCIMADTGLYHQFSSLGATLGQEIEFFHLERHSPGYFEPLKLTKTNLSGLTELIEIRDSISENDLVAILYTSGTSGNPKGVMLTHKNLVSNLLYTLTVFPLQSGVKVLSFLPFSHVFERSACYVYIACGASIYFSRDRESVSLDFQSVQPYFCTTVPRILEKMYDFLMEQRMQSGKLKRMIMDWSMRVAVASEMPVRGRRRFNFKLMLARILVLRHWRKLLGGKMQCMVVGAAALRPEIGRLMSAAGIRIREGYGMTETSPVIALNRFDPGMNRFGTVGIPLSGLQLKIAGEKGEETGEILVKGPNVTQGYYKQPELTRAAFTEDGWFKTGDVGQIVDHRFLKITDRKKDIFKTSAGKYIAPLPLENLLTSSDYIQQCLIIGFNRSFITALIVPNFGLLRQWCLQEGIHWTSPQYMVHNIKVRARIQTEMDAINETLPNFKRVRNFVLCHQEWTPDAGEVTHTLKPKRLVLLNNFAKEIEKMYAP